MKPKLLLLHGAIGSKAQFDGFKALQDTFEIFSINFSGHGGEPLPEKFTMKLFSDDILRFIEKEKISPINIFGYSMGGYAALYLASRYPEKVRRIFTLATKFDWTEESAARESRMLNPEKILEKVPQFAAELEKRHAPGDWKEVLSKTVAMMLDLGKKPALGRKEFEGLNIPVLLCRGENDAMVSAEETNLVHGMVRGSQCMTLPGIQHPIEKVPADVLIEEIKKFFL